MSGGCLRRRAQSFVFALRGIRQLVMREPNARFHAVAATAVAALGLWLHISPVGLAVLALAIGLVFAAEAGNTALEALADRLAPDPHPLVEVAKDVAAAGVLLAAVAAAAAGLAILGPPLLRRLGL